jgi:DNA-binding MarR family transcriptional regulator
MPSHVPPRSDDIARSSEQIALPALMRAARQTYGAAIRAALAAEGCDDLPRNGAFVIGAIARGGNALSDVIGALGVSKQAGGALVDSLVTRRYLDRTIDADDRRRLHVTLTPRGEQAAVVIRYAVEDIDAQLVALVGAEFVGHARTVLLALAGLGADA